MEGTECLKKRDECDYLIYVETILNRAKSALSVVSLDNTWTSDNTWTAERLENIYIFQRTWMIQLLSVNFRSLAVICY